MFNCCAFTLALSLLTMSSAYGATAFDTQNAVAGDHDNLEPDRPDVTNGTHIVDVGLLQMEVGGVWTRTGIGRHSVGTPSTLRLGLTEWLEARSPSAEVPGPVTPYLEGFWFSRQDPDGGRVAALDSGAIYVITPRLALDGGIQVGLTDATPSLSAFGGLSVVIGNVLADHGVHARQRQSAKRGAVRATGAR